MATVGELRSSHDFSSPNSSSEYKIQKDPTVGGQPILSTQSIKLTCCPLNQILRNRNVQRWVDEIKKKKKFGFVFETYASSTDVYSSIYRWLFDLNECMAYDLEDYSISVQ